MDKKSLGYAKCDSMSGVFLELGLPTADTIVHHTRVLFASHCSLSCNQIAQWFAKLLCGNLIFCGFYSLCVLVCF